MIKQTATGLDSRSQASPFNEDGFLPLITAPMLSLINEKNYEDFIDTGVQVCLPRGIKPNINSNKKYWDQLWYSFSLQDFIEVYVDSTEPLISTHKALIDVANGNMGSLHDAIKKAKHIHGKNLILMAGNVASVEAFMELAKSGCDFIRCGIGGGGSCNTTSNTGVGQPCLEQLIRDCHAVKQTGITELVAEEITDNDYGGFRPNYRRTFPYQHVQIVADGISTYIKQCEAKYGFNDNGYAAINTLLDAGSNLVMVGSLFAQCLESAGSKYSREWEQYVPHNQDYDMLVETMSTGQLYVKYSGMSTQSEQTKYKQIEIRLYKGNGVLAGYCNTIEEAKQTCSEQPGWYYETNLKPSEGSTKFLPVRWTLNEWLHGSTKQDEYPYLMGWVNSVKSMMAYTNKIKLS